MTDRIRSSRRLIIIAAAMLGTAAVILVLGVVPPVRSDAFPDATPGSAAAMFLIQAALAAFAALVLAIVAARAAELPRPSIAMLMVIGSLVVLLGMGLVGPAKTFWGHGPTLHRAVVFMFVSAAAELAAIGALAAAAARLRESVPGPAASQDTGAWKVRIAPAAALGVGSLFLMFFVGEGGRNAASSPAAELIRRSLLGIVLGGYSMVATYMLSRGLPRAAKNLWLVLALNAVLMLMALIALLAEPNKLAALQTLGLAIVSGAGSCGGLALAARGTKPQVAPTN